MHTNVRENGRIYPINTHQILVCKLPTIQKLQSLVYVVKNRLKQSVKTILWIWGNHIYMYKCSSKFHWDNPNILNKYPSKFSTQTHNLSKVGVPQIHSQKAPKLRYRNRFYNLDKTYKHAPMCKRVLVRALKHTQ